MDFTGERYIPTLDWPELSYEHWHRYLYASQFVAGKSVLDLSSGEGFGSNLLAETAKSVIGIDIDPATVTHAAARYARANLEFVCGPAQAVPLEGEHLFDVLVSFETIEHLDEQQQIAFINEAKRLLKPTGLALFSTPNKLLYSDRHQYRNEFHQREFYYEEFVQFLSQYFKKVSILGQRVYPGSYIWPVDPMPRPLWEFQLTYTDTGFAPEVRDGKELYYLLAVCSDEATQFPPPPSVLLDLSERATVARVRQLDERDQALRALIAQAEQNQNTIQELESQAEKRSTAEQVLIDGLRVRSSATRVMIDELLRSIEGKAGRPYVRATPNPVPIGSGCSNGTTTIEWSTEDDSPGWLYVAESVSEERLFATGAVGSQVAPWIARDTAYDFVLYGDEGRSLPLASVCVEMDRGMPETPYIRTSIDSGRESSEPEAGTGTVEWSTGDGSPGWVYLQRPGGKQIFVADGPRGSLPIAWIEQRSSCRFVLFGDEQCQKDLASVRWETNPIDGHGLHIVHKPE